jgi:hypothetical protein
MCQSVGVFALFISSPYLCTKVKIIFVGCVLIIAATGYIVLEAMLKMEKKIQKADVISSLNIPKETKDSTSEPLCEKTS